MSELERELRAALSDPPGGADELDGFSPLDELRRRIDAHVRRRRIMASAAAVVAVFAFGAAGVRALNGGEVTSTAQSANGYAVPANGDAGHELGSRGIPPPSVLTPSGSSAPAEVVAAARIALTKVVNGKPAGVLRWAPVGDTYLVQIPLATTTRCKVCRDPGGIPETGAVIELRVPRAIDASAGGHSPVPSPPANSPQAGTPPGGGTPTIHPPAASGFPGYRLLSTQAATDLSKLAGAQQAPFHG